MYHIKFDILTYSHTRCAYYILLPLYLFTWEWDEYRGTSHGFLFVFAWTMSVCTISKQHETWNCSVQYVCMQYVGAGITQLPAYCILHTAYCIPFTTEIHTGMGMPFLLKPPPKADLRRTARKSTHGIRIPSPLYCRCGPKWRREFYLVALSLRDFSRRHLSPLRQ
jgi:hypothetical protein